MTNAEALLLFKGWRDSRKLVSCKPRLFSNWTFALRGGIVEFAEDDGSVRIAACGGDVLVELNVLSCDAAEYGATGSQELIVLLLPLRSGQPPTTRDRLAFVATTAE